ncbi:hypothetical protein [Terrabacter carboxydivorans]|uniref:DUF4352 domain-containing protein n=1 Tax=Terrabacter carboxydivorans TaxID=619730 RepID=A0ABN3M4X1_9MICO
MTTTTSPSGPAAGTDRSSSRLGRDGRSRTAVAVVAVLLVAVLGLLGARALRAGGDDPGRAVPQSAGMETALGVRISRVAVVGDGGLVTMSYVVLDVDKASRFQADTKHPPVLRSEARDGFTDRVSVMRQGHINRAGATYYFVYQNTRGALRAGEDVTVEYGGLRLEHVPVL